MNQDELKNFCVDVREALEKMTKKDHSRLSSFGNSNFPVGCCGDTSKLLAYLLYQQFGIVSEVLAGCYYESDHKSPASGLSNGNSHAWLVVDGMIVDLTADQFNDRGYNNLPVMITSDTRFHDLFANRNALFQPSQGNEIILPNILKMTASHVQQRLKERGW
ncbi:TPA: hypothetical protein L0V44_002514 [Escherichia coli]|uniref:hypothetical protein n=1 Tax=Escherichia coli TaxID=562 RepID=UPI000F6E0032|nr:hypothetical protein [Escherichia coli]EFH4200206.1 hypothetical protein [Escherichia coli]EFL5686654.1 hypothetical protein [Escherichia coli]EJL4161037.1 hypothetical protein [Escherichia coli]VED01801.1 Uncharacterised protein [Escherichia coli]HAO7374164.1 hypothetical protein [Escherichia coli]